MATLRFGCAAFLAVVHTASRLGWERERHHHLLVLLIKLILPLELPALQDTVIPQYLSSWHSSMHLGRKMPQEVGHVPGSCYLP